MIVRQYEVGSLSVFAYLVADEKTKAGLFIDPAAETDKLVREAESLGLEIKYIVNTHSHIDHVMGNREMVKKTGARIVIHEADEETLVRPPAYLLEMFNATASPPADILVREGDLIEAGSVSLRVLHTPGHSPGAICLYQEGMVFTGDTLFVGGVGRTDFPGCSWEDLENSIRTKLFALPGKTVVYPGHQYGATPTSTIDHEKRHNPFVRG
jgi:glyoxylase-like metal-dependent hydrolase (beta-lactamase superfamily II)